MTNNFFRFNSYDLQGNTTDDRLGFRLALCLIGTIMTVALLVTWYLQTNYHAARNEALRLVGTHTVSNFRLGFFNGEFHADLEGEDVTFPNGCPLSIEMFARQWYNKPIPKAVAITFTFVEATRNQWMPGAYLRADTIIVDEIGFCSIGRDSKERIIEYNR